jgi:DNA-binding PadR family transcriptional regulator
MKERTDFVPPGGRSPDKSKPDKMLPKGDSELILTAIAGAELYGRQIKQAIEEGSEGRLTLSLANLSKIVNLLVEKGLVEARLGHLIEGGDSRKTYYRLTRKGIRTLDEIDAARKAISEWRPPGWVFKPTEPYTANLKRQLGETEERED